MEESCPACHADLRGEPIPTEYLEQGWYGKWDGVTPRFCSRIVGVEIPGVHDGVLFWQCPDCGHRWHRWPEGSRLRPVAARYVEAGADV